MQGARISMPARAAPAFITPSSNGNACRRDKCFASRGESEQKPGPSNFSIIPTSQRTSNGQSMSAFFEALTGQVLGKSG